MSRTDDAMNQSALLLDVYRAARALFDKRFSEGRETETASTMYRQQWANLGAALYGEEDPRVVALRPPRPTFRVGDWVVDPDGEVCIVSGRQDGLHSIWLHRLNGEALSGSISWPIVRIRLATPEEIAKARGEA